MAKVMAFVSNFGILFFPNSAFNIRISYKISSRKALYFRSYQPKTSRGWTTPPPPVLLGLNKGVAALFIC